MTEQNGHRRNSVDHNESYVGLMRNRHSQFAEYVAIAFQDEFGKDQQSGQKS